MNYILSVSILLFSVMGVCAQNIEIRGFITGLQQEPLENAIVSVEKDQLITEYTHTTSDGYYKVSINRGEKVSIRVQAFGYQDTIISLDISQLNSEELTHRIDINMRSLKVSLDNIVIRDEKIHPFSNSDTIRINPDRYRDSTEVTLEDLLSNISGIQISDDGNISVQGKPVKKILIEGDDLFSNQYKLLTKNLNADAVKDIEIISKFVDNPLYKGFVDTDDYALNILLKKNKLGTLFGSVQAGIGNNDNHDDKLNLGWLSDKIKIFAPANYNTIGDNYSKALSDRRQVTIQDIMSNNLWKSNQIFDPLSDQGGTNINLPTRYQAPNKTYYFSMGSVVNLNKNNKLTIRGINLNDKDKMEKSREYIIRLPQEDIVQFYKSEIDRDNQYNEYELFLDSKTSESSSLETKVIREIKNQNFKDIEEEIGLKTQYTSQNHNANYSFQTRYTKRINSRQLFVAQLYYLPSSSTIDINVNPDIISTTDTIRDQQLSTLLSNYGLNIKHTIKTKNLRINMVGAAATNKNTGHLRIGPVITSTPDSGKAIIDDSRFKYLDYSFQINIEKIVGRTTLKLKSNIFYQTQDIHSSSSSSQSQEKWATYPRASITHKLASIGTISLGYHKDYRTPDISVYHPRALLTGFRNIKAGFDNIFWTTANSVFINYHYNNWDRVFLVNMSLLYSNQPKATNQISQYDERTTFSKMEIFGQHNNRILTGSIHKFISPLNGTLSLAITNTQVSNTSLLNGIETDVSFVSTGIDLTARANSKIIKNTLKFSFNLSNTKSESPLLDNPDEYAQLKIQNSLKIIMGKKSFLHFDGLLNIDNATRSPARFYSTVSYQAPIRRSRLRFRAELFNIFNSEILTNVVNTENTSSIEQISLNKRHFIVTLRYTL